MLQVRKLVLAVAAVTAFTSGFANALGLGELAVKSSLNQPLEAEITLLEVRDLTSANIKTRLASAEDFTKAGVERQFFLTGLTFTPMVGVDGKSVIRVTSAKPVKEPYLNFLVEVLWPNGRLLREYTLLLNPPLYKPGQVSSVQPVVTAGATLTQLNSASKSVAMPQAARPTEYRVKKAEVTEQNASWKNRRTTALVERQLDATERQQTDAAPQEIEHTDSLKLVVETPSESKQASDRGRSNELQDLQDQNADLTEQMAAQNAELDAQSDLETAQSTQDISAPIEQDELFAVGSAVDQEVDESTLAGTAPTDAEDTVRQDASPAAVANKDAPAVENKSIVDQIMANPALVAVAGGGAVLALLLGLLGLSRRKARQQHNSNQPLPQDFIPEYANELEPVQEDDIFQMDAKASLAGQPTGDTATQAPKFIQETTDPLVEANSYMSFARFTQAAEVLHDALDQEPQRLDLQLKLLEVYAELNDQSAFLTQVTALQDVGAEQAEIDAITARYPQLLVLPSAAADTENLDAELDYLSAQLDATQPLTDSAEAEFDLGFELPEQSSKPAQSEFSDDEFSFDDIVLDLDESKSIPTAEIELSEEFDFTGLELNETQVTETVITDSDFAELDFENIELSNSVAPTASAGAGEAVFLDDLDFVPYADAATAQLNLARTYIEQGDMHAAGDILHEVIAQGAPEQQEQARQLLTRLVK
ncbi:MAG TPA: FimV/HubP family polar landmark protein [Thiopseudomonas sp.]|nr:FimV/HubP family polar landmark protein [Thiopseudomonas sp.]